MGPARTKTGRKSGKAFRQLDEWADSVSSAASDSGTGFAIGPDAAVRSPDAWWVAQERIDRLTSADAEGFWPLSPDVVIELRSPSDSLRATVAAVDRFMARGSTYGVAVDLETREVVERGHPPGGTAITQGRGHRRVKRCRVASASPSSGIAWLDASLLSHPHGDHKEFMHMTDCRNTIADFR